MTAQNMIGMAQTVLGPVEARELGVVLPHEHLFCDLSCYMSEPRDPAERKLAHQGIRLDNLWFARHNLFCNEDNLVLDSEELAVKEAAFFKDAGGGTIVDVSPIGVGRCPRGLANVAKATGLHVIMGTSYYVANSRAPELGSESKTEDDIAEEFIGEIRNGVDGTGMKAGIIGEIGCSWPLEEVERRALRAAGIAQQETGTAISLHPGAHEGAPLEHIRMLEEVGADASRVIIGHMTRTLPPDARTARARLAETGCYLEFDWFGREGDLPVSLASQYDRVNDVSRIHQILQLVEDGYLERVLISHDICFKVMLRSYGGGGYGYILKFAVPEMLKMGMTEEQIHTITVENPRRAFAFA